MGLSLKNLFKTAATAIIGGPMTFSADVGGSAFGIEDPRTAVAVTGISSLFGPQAGQFASGLAASFDDPYEPPSYEPPIYRDTGEVVSGGGGGYGGGVMATSMVTAVPAMVMAAIIKLSQRFGGAGRSPLAYGRRIWDSLSSWAAKNPGVSLLSLLTGVGLSLDEAAHFLAWGATKKRRRRRRGISAANLRNARRTLRTIVKMYHSLPHTSGARRVFGGSRTSIVKA